MNKWEATYRKILKDELYDRMSKLLTDYEHPEDAVLPVDADDLYVMLVEIHRNWEEVTSDDD